METAAAVWSPGSVKAQYFCWGSGKAHVARRAKASRPWDIDRTIHLYKRQWTFPIYFLELHYPKQYTAATTYVQQMCRRSERTSELGVQ